MRDLGKVASEEAFGGWNAWWLVKAEDRSVKQGEGFHMSEGDDGGSLDLI